MEFLLTSLLLLPFIGAAIGVFLPGGRAARSWALLVSLLTALLAVILAYQFFNAADLNISGVMSKHYRISFSPETVDKLTLNTIGFSINLGVDAISLWLVLLTAFLMPLAVAASFGSIKDREKEYYAWMTMLLGAMVGVFLARDGLLFYIFFELTLIPMFFIIGIWGGPERRYAAGKFFLFTFAGSVFTLAALVYLAMQAGGDGKVSFSITRMVAYAQDHLSQTERFWVLLGILAGLAVKVPLFPVHTWLPLAHTEAPTAGSVILAGVLLKLGTYGILRFAVPMGMVANGKVMSPGVIHVVGILCLIGIIYGALVAWVQQDIKKLVAYSSVSHLGFCILGLIALNDWGMQGSVLYMINHGLSTGAMFLVIGMIYDRYHTRDINALSGLARIMPKMAFFFILFTMASIGLPGLNGFVSEFLTILGAFTSDYLGVGYGVVAALGIILGAVYMLHMSAKVIWGPLKFPAGDHGAADHDAHDQADHGQAASPDSSHGGHGESHAPRRMNDLTGREMTILVPIALAVILLGILPNTILTSILEPLRAIGLGQPQVVATDSKVVPTPAVAGAAVVPVADTVARLR
jgi:NADH-quinone oxidoreductase subunit M